LPGRPITVTVHPGQPGSPSEAWLTEIADRALSALALPSTASLEIVVTDDDTVRELNLRHRGLDETTDVLSFSSESRSKNDFVLPPGAGETGSIGEVIISGPQSARQAAQNEREPAEELAFLLAHGILHLMGHDHEEPLERREMEEQHRRLLIAMLGPSASSIPVSYPS
jgi:probable rRNA maturation factor